MEGCKPLHCICCGFSLPQRFVMAILCAAGVVVGYGQRVGLSIAITRIVGGNHSLQCIFPRKLAVDDRITGGTYKWPESIQGWLLNSFYVGYFIGQIPCGISADILGAKMTYIIGEGVATVVTVATPIVMQYTHWGFVYFTRLVLGIAQSVMYPSMSVLIAHWVPPFERATLGAFCFASNSLGVVIGYLMSGFIMNYTRYWPNIFYFWAGVSLVWLSLFTMFAYNAPEFHPHITEKEKLFLEEELLPCTYLKIPWKGLLGDRGIWALVIGELGHDIVLYMMVTNMPKYFNDVLNLSIKDITLIASLPFTGIWVISIIAGKLSDYGIHNKNWNIRITRCSMTYLSFLIANLMLCLMVLMKCNTMAAILCFATAVIAKGPHYASFRVNHMDLTVNFNGITMALINMSGCIGGFVSPVIISHVASNNRFEEWTIVTWIYFGISFATITFYVTMAKFERAKWDVAPGELDDFERERDDRVAEKEARKEKKRLEKAAKRESSKT